MFQAISSIFVSTLYADIGEQEDVGEYDYNYIQMKQLHIQLCGYSASADCVVSQQAYIVLSGSKFSFYLLINLGAWEVSCTLQERVDKLRCWLLTLLMPGQWLEQTKECCLSQHNDIIPMFSLFMETHYFKTEEPNLTGI